MANETTTKPDAKQNKKGAAPPPVGLETAPETTAMTAPPETQALGEVIFDYGDDTGQGYENQDMSDRKLPIIELLQANSPEVQNSKGKIWAGQFHNTVTNEIYDEVYFIPAITDHCWLAFVPRDDGGGFKGRYAKDSKVVADAIARNDGRAMGKLPFPQPNNPKTGKPEQAQELVENFEIYGILLNKAGEIMGFAMIPFASTKIKIYKAWNTAIATFAPTFYGVKDASGQMHGQFTTAEAAQKKAATVQGSTVNLIKLRPGAVPIFGHRVKMTSEAETKNSNTYMIPVLSPAEGGDDLKNSLLPRTDPRYAEAKKLHDDVLAGLAKADYETAKQDPGVDPEAGVPF